MKIKKLITLSFDFAMRRSFYRNTIRYYRKAKKVLRGLAKLATKAAGEESAEDVFIGWEKSGDKVPVEVYFEETPKKDPVLYGEISFAIEAPANIMREYVERAFRDRLNEEQLGDSFLFFVITEGGRSDTLAREKEGGTYSKDYCPFKMDNKVTTNCI